MPEEIDKKLEYLKHDEVKTMEKDIAGLREGEAKEEREKISQIKTEEEIQKEKAREAMAQKAAQERKAAEEAAARRETEIKRTREEQGKQGAILGKETIIKEGERAEGFKEAMRETQIREEEERKRFLERVAAKAEGLPANRPDEAASPLSPRPAAPKEEIHKPFLRRPSFFQKLGVRIVLIVLVLAMIAGLASFWYWYLKIKAKPVPAENIKTELTVPTSLITPENSQTIEFSSADELNIALAELLKATSTLGSTRLVLKNTTENKIWGVKEFFEALQIKTPDGFVSQLNNDFTLLVFSQEEGQRMALVAKIKEGEISSALDSWEETMESDLAGLFSLLGKTEPALSPSFKNSSYLNIPFRFQTFSRQDLGIVYAVDNEYFVLTTSWQGLQEILDKLKGEPISLLPFSPGQGAEFVLKSLSLKEKIGQVLLIGLGDKTTALAMDDLLVNVQPGSVLLLEGNIKAEIQLKELTQGLQKASLSYAGLPLLIAVDQEGGDIARVTFAKEKTAQNDIADADHAFRVGLKRGEELLALGINLNLGPVLDSAEPGDFLFSRSFQKSLAAAAEMAKSLIFGQKKSGILTTLKHFPGYDGVTFNPEGKLAVLAKTPDTSYFLQAAGASPELIMTSNAVYRDLDENLPFTFSPAAIRFLKKNLGDNYLIVSDDLCQKSLLDQFSLEEIVKLPVKAGVDILTCSDPAMARTAAAILYASVVNKEIPEERIDSSVLKIIQLKESLIE